MKLERRAAGGRIKREALRDPGSRKHCGASTWRSSLWQRSRTAADTALSLEWHVDVARRARLLELDPPWDNGACSVPTATSGSAGADRAYAFRGQWNVEELFRRGQKKRRGGASWGPSHQVVSDNSLRLHTFATVIGPGTG